MKKKCLLLSVVVLSVVAAFAKKEPVTQIIDLSSPGNQNDLGWTYSGGVIMLYGSASNCNNHDFIIDSTNGVEVTAIGVCGYGCNLEDPMTIEIRNGYFGETFGMNRLDSNSYARVSLKITGGDFRCKNNPFTNKSPAFDETEYKWVSMAFMSPYHDDAEKDTVEILGGDFSFDPNHYVKLVPVNYDGTRFHVGKVIISFDPNGGKVEVESKRFRYGATYNEYGGFPEPKKRFAKFTGWKIGTAVMDPESTCVLAGDKTAFAQWKPAPLPITFLANGGTGSMAKFEITENAPANLPPCAFTHPTRRFKGWKCSNGRLYDDKVLIVNPPAEENSLTMTAVWE